MVGACKRRPSAAIVGGACAAREGDLSALPPLIREKVMKDKRKPAELIRTDLITAMKIPDTEHLEPEHFWPIVDPWKTDYDKGVQVPVNPEGTPNILVKQRKDTTARDAVVGPFSMPAKLISVSGEQAASGALFDPARHEWCDAAAKQRQLEARPRYNLDELDFAWLQLLNRQRGACGLLELTEEVLEMVVDDLETRCHNNMTANQLGIEFDEDTQCDVCFSPDSEEGNDMVFCDACDLCVHQACYGIVTVPAGSWLCAPCARGYSAKPPCALCPSADGALKPDADADLWAHVTCALWIPEITIGTPELMEPLQNLHRIPSWRRRLTCSVCGREGRGACIQCSFDGCATAYHVTCAQKAGLSLLMCAADVSNPLLELKSFCPAHARYRNTALAPHTYKKVIEYGGPSALAGSCGKRGRSAGHSPVSTESAEAGGGNQQFLDFVDPNETAAHLRRFVDPLGVDQIFNFWKLKRLERQGRALLPPKQEENGGLQRPVHIDDELSTTIRSLVNLRQDLERARNLSYLVQRREKQRKLWIRAREDVTMGQLRAAEEHPESVRIIRTANRLDDVYDRLHSFEKVYGVPASSVVTSLMRTVARDNEKIHGLSTSRLESSLAYPPAAQPATPIAPRRPGRPPGPSSARFRPPQSIAPVSPMVAEVRNVGKRQREQQSPEGDENDVPLQRARTRLNFSTTVLVLPATATPTEKQLCSSPETAHRNKQDQPSTLSTPVASPSRGTSSATGTPDRSPSTPRTPSSSTSQGTGSLKFLRVGRRRGGPFKRSMVPDLQSGSPERPFPPASAPRVGRPPSTMAALSTRPVSATTTTTTASGAAAASSKSLPQHQLHENARQPEQVASQHPKESKDLPSDRSAASHDRVTEAGQKSCSLTSATQTTQLTSTGSVSAASGDDVHAEVRSPTGKLGHDWRRYNHRRRPGSDEASLENLRVTRGRKSLADTAVGAWKGNCVRGRPRKLIESLAVQISSSRSINNTSPASANCGQTSGAERDPGDESDSSVEILTGAELHQRTRNSTRSTAILEEPPAPQATAPLPPGGVSAERKSRHAQQQLLVSRQLQQQLTPATCAGRKPSPSAPADAAGDDAPTRSPGRPTSSTGQSTSYSSDANRNESSSYGLGRGSKINGGPGRRPGRPPRTPERQQRGLSRALSRSLRSKEKEPSVDCVPVPAHNGVPENGVSPPEEFDSGYVGEPADVIVSNGLSTTQSLKTEGEEASPNNKGTHPQAPAMALAESDGRIGAGPAARESRRFRNRPVEADLRQADESGGGKITSPSAIIGLSRLPRKHSPSSPSRTSAEPLVLRSNARQSNGRMEASPPLARGGNSPYGGHGSRGSVPYAFCYLDCTVRLQRLSEAQLQRFVSAVPKHETGRTT
ncbi:protein Jade-1-like [Tropilaelaps mercedesae]|uniref:PHD finger protein rhinoceros n=1 Tax=Tropilaelaps mercedesae TaxID=418985 RepID=A0A1V9X9V8_9ACAR|nr:protein Jade-1-like [Tropilaelaps mercedesae]